MTQQRGRLQHPGDSSIYVAILSFLKAGEPFFTAPSMYTSKLVFQSKYLARRSMASLNSMRFSQSLEKKKNRQTSLTVGNEPLRTSVNFHMSTYSTDYR